MYAPVSPGMFVAKPCSGENRAKHQRRMEDFLASAFESACETAPEPLHPLPSIAGDVRLASLSYRQDIEIGLRRFRLTATGILRTNSMPLLETSTVRIGMMMPRPSPAKPAPRRTFPNQCGRD